MKDGLKDIILLESDEVNLMDQSSGINKSVDQVQRDLLLKHHLLV